MSDVFFPSQRSIVQDQDEHKGRTTKQIKQIYTRRSNSRDLLEIVPRSDQVLLAPL